MNAARVGSLLVLAGFVLALLITPIAAVPGYDLSGEPAIEFPSETVTYEGKEYTVDSVTRVTASESVLLTADVKNQLSYYINLRGPDNAIISSERKTGDSTHEISYYGSGEAGTYAATIQDNGSTQAVHPIVIPGYWLNVSAPATVAADESFTVRVQVTERDVEKHSSLAYLELVIGNKDVELTQEFSKVNSTTYETTVSASELDTTDYDLFVTVRGDEEVRQRDEILAVSDPSALTVSTAETPTQTVSPTQTATPTATDQSQETQNDATPTDSTGSTSSPTVRQTPTSTASDDETASPTDRTATDTRTPSTTTASPRGATSTQRSATPTADAVIEPATRTPTLTTGGAGPGFGALLALLVLVCTLISTVRKMD